MSEKALRTALARSVVLIWLLDRFAAGFLCVSAAETLANATNCRFCGCVCRRWIVRWAVRTGMSRFSGADGQILHDSCSLNRSSASSSSQTFSTVCLMFGGLVIRVNHSLDRGQKWSLNCD